jgi:hypothetical protein
VLEEDVAELEELSVLVDDAVLDIVLLETLLGIEEEVAMLDDVEELIEDDGVLTGQDVPVVKTVVIVVVAVLVTVCIRSAIIHYGTAHSLRFQGR